MTTRKDQGTHRVPGWASDLEPESFIRKDTKSPENPTKEDSKPRRRQRVKLTTIDLLFVVNVHLREPDEHPGQDAEELQVGACLPDLQVQGGGSQLSVRPGAALCHRPRLTNAIARRRLRHGRGNWASGSAVGGRMNAQQSTGPPPPATLLRIQHCRRVSALTSHIFKLLETGLHRQVEKVRFRENKLPI